MFGRPKPVVLDRYGSRRSRAVLPRWLLLLLLGAGLGIAAVMYIQERVLPPRLSVSESAQLRQSFEQADAERLRLQGELGKTGEQLKATLADKDRLTRELTASRDAVERLREDVGALVASLPPDPRGSAVAVRAARFEVDGNTLVYDVVLSRDRAAQPFKGVLQFVVAGTPADGPERTLKLEPVPISVGRYESVRGSLPLPDGFRPRQTTVQVLDRPGGKLSGMRVLYVK